MSVETLPRLGFLGVGWIGRNRMEAVYRAGAASIGALADLDAQAAQRAAATVDCDQVCASLDELLERGLDGIVIATPTGLHPAQVRAALDAGVPVFCQKPLGRTAAETAELIDLARRADLRLGVDMSYRHLAAVDAALAELRAGAIGAPHAAELLFHNAYGPDKAWVTDSELAGGGALIDLGPHLIDLAGMFLGHLPVAHLHADLFAAGRPLAPDRSQVEDLALAQVTLADGRALRIACSWWLPAGTDAVIEATFFGAHAALRIRNVGGSFFDFEAQLVRGREVSVLCSPPDDWGGRALIEWARALGRERSYDPGIERLVAVAELIDAIYTGARS